MVLEEAGVTDECAVGGGGSQKKAGVAVEEAPF